MRIYSCGINFATLVEGNPLGYKVLFTTVRAGCVNWLQRLSPTGGGGISRGGVKGSLQRRGTFHRDDDGNAKLAG